MISERLVNLLELLRFYAETYMQIAKNLHDLNSGFKWTRLRERSRHETVNSLQAMLIVTKTCCEEIGLKVSIKHADELLLIARHGEVEDQDIKALHENIRRELSCRFYVGISEDRKEAYCDSLKGWEVVLTRFPAATEDVEEMNKCYALCRYSASVFHSLLVMDHGLVALGKSLGVTDPKEGWDSSCKKLATTINAGRTANSTGLDFEFLEQVNTCIQVIKLAWRNKVNHATGKPMVMHGGFAPYVAEETIAATRSFMRRLAEGLS